MVVGRASLSLRYANAYSLGLSSHCAGLRVQFAHPNANGCLHGNTVGYCYPKTDIDVYANCNCHRNCDGAANYTTHAHSHFFTGNVFHLAHQLAGPTGL